MRKVSLRMNEEQKYQTIKELADHGENKLRVLSAPSLTGRKHSTVIFTSSIRSSVITASRRSSRPIGIPSFIIEIA